MGGGKKIKDGEKNKEEERGKQERQEIRREIGKREEE